MINEINRKLLEHAAEASNLEWSRNPEITHDGLWITAPAHRINTYWNPLAHDGDAFLLAVTLGITVTPYPIYTQEKHSVIAKRHQSGDLMRKKNPTEVIEIYEGNPAAATRKAIVRCANAIWMVTTHGDRLSNVSV